MLIHGTYAGCLSLFVRVDIRALIARAIYSDFHVKSGSPKWESRSLFISRNFTNHAARAMRARKANYMTRPN